LHAVTDDAVLARPDFMAVAAALLAAGGGALALHLRGPDTDGASLYRVASELAPEARDEGAWLLVNDRVDVALAAGVTDVHLGQRSLDAAGARALLGPLARVGVSCHDAEEVERAAELGADFVFVGTIFSTPSHPGRQGMGVKGLEAACARSGSLPVLAIGGVLAPHVPPLLWAGAHGVAVVRGIWDRPDPTAAMAHYLQTIEETVDER
jgi:thiamine-phosphate pyrophosphorylase